MHASIDRWALIPQQVAASWQCLDLSSGVLNSTNQGALARHRPKNREL